MDRQRNSSEQSISSAESWEMVKIDENDKELVSVPLLPDDTENSSMAFDQQLVGRKISTESSLGHFVCSADSPMDDEPSVCNSDCSWDNERLFCVASSAGGSSTEMANGTQSQEQPNGNDGMANENNHNDKIINLMQQAFGLMAVLFFAVALAALLSNIKTFSFSGFHPSNGTAAEWPVKVAMGSESFELLHGFCANCTSQLEHYKIAYAANLAALKRLKSEKTEHKKAIRKLQAELAKLKSAARSSGDGSPPLLPPATPARQSANDHQPQGERCANVAPIFRTVSCQGEFWAAKRAVARTEYRLRRLLDNYPTPSIGTFGTKFTKWFFERAALRQKRRKLNSNKQNYYRHNSHYSSDDEDDTDQDDHFDHTVKGGGWRWAEQRHKIRAKLRELGNKFDNL